LVRGETPFHFETRGRGLEDSNPASRTFVVVFLITYPLHLRVLVWRVPCTSLTVNCGPDGSPPKIFLTGKRGALDRPWAEHVVTLGNEASVVAGPRTSPGKLAPSAESFSPATWCGSLFLGAGNDFDSARRIVHEIGLLPGRYLPLSPPLRVRRNTSSAESAMLCGSPRRAVPSERAGIACRFSRDVPDWIVKL
jgi:hypothetical protein